MDAGMLVEVANELFAAGKYEAALSSYDDAIKLAPNAPEVHCNRGAALRNLGRVDEAIEALDRAIALKPDFPEALNNKGMTFLLASRKEEALECFQLAIQANERYIQGYLGAAQVLNALSRFPEARELTSKGIEIEPSPQLYGELAFTLLRMGDLEAAVVQARTAIEMSGGAPTVRMRQTLAVALSTIAKQLLDGGEVAHAIEKYSEAIAVEETDGRLFNRAVCHVQNDTPELALKDLERVLQLNPSSHNAHVLSASLHMVAKNWEASGNHFGAAFNIMPSALDERLLYQFGFVLLKQEKFAEAEAQFRRVLEVDPENSAAQSALELLAVRGSGGGEDGGAAAEEGGAPASEEYAGDGSGAAEAAGGEGYEQEYAGQEYAGQEYAGQEYAGQEYADSSGGDGGGGAAAAAAEEEYTAPVEAPAPAKRPGPPPRVAAPAAAAPPPRRTFAVPSAPVVRSADIVTSSTVASTTNDDEEEVDDPSLGHVQRLALKFQRKAEKSSRRPSFFGAK